MAYFRAEREALSRGTQQLHSSVFVAWLSDELPWHQRWLAFLII